MSVGENIKNLRIKNKLTQVELAEKLAVSPKTISSWENNHNVPDIYMLISLSEIFNTSIDDILGVEKDNKILKENYEKNKFKNNLLKIIFIAILVGIPVLFFRYVNLISLSAVASLALSNELDLNQVYAVDHMVNVLTIKYCIYLLLLLINYILFCKKYKNILLILNSVIFVATLCFLIYNLSYYFDYLLFLIASKIGLYWGIKLVRNIKRGLSGN